MTDRTHGALYDSEAALRLVDSTLHDLTGVSSGDIDVDGGAAGAVVDAECRVMLQGLATVRQRLEGAMAAGGWAQHGEARDRLAQARACLDEAQRSVMSCAGLVECTRPTSATL